jgi:hypothetical protein
VRFPLQFQSLAELCASFIEAASSLEINAYATIFTDEINRSDLARITGLIA